jgi:hypothetical protein
MDKGLKAHKTRLLLDDDDALPVILAKADGGMGARGTATEDSYINFDDGVGADDSRSREAEGGKEGGECEGHDES